MLLQCIYIQAWKKGKARGDEPLKTCEISAFQATQIAEDIDEKKQ